MEIIAAAVLYSKDIYVVTNTVSEGRVGWVRYTKTITGHSFTTPPSTYIQNCKTTNTWIEICNIDKIHFDPVQCNTDILKLPP